MSRIGKLPINIPNTVNVKIENQIINVMGPHGQLKKKISDFLIIKINNNEIIVLTKNNSRQARSLHGLYRTLINNMIIGVSNKFEQRLEIKGVGYRSQVQDTTLILNLGFSHPIQLQIPVDIEIVIEANVNILIRGINKETVGQFAATIRNKRPPEPYKGKGILYKEEIIKRKVGKSGK
jgi:large subunit ribosomal protein L6|uniref:Large ribosomal subunit protein uL6c n=1 Tax=Vaucheria litorea TaxID=109269 RepID=B7T1X0_VAULI|nr:ribosomal protein L6 [Vaucheria litorea]ACF70936.1 ribosomal protein L6 [Vaucheria litorea]